MTTIGRRLAQVRAELKISQTVMAKSLGIAQSTLSQLEKGNSGISSDVLGRLLEHFRISADWMITGLGPQHVPLGAGHAGIPLIKSDARAGYLENEGSKTFLEMLEHYKLPNFEGEGDYRIFGVEGDSMIPTFFPGDNVVCEKLEDLSGLHEGTLAVIVGVEELVIKRASYFDSSEGALILRSDNPTYKPQMMMLEEVREVWIVRARITTTLDHAVVLTNQKISRFENELGEVREHLSELRRLIKMQHLDQLNGHGYDGYDEES